LGIFEMRIVKMKNRNPKKAIAIFLPADGDAGMPGRAVSICNLHSTFFN